MMDRRAFISGVTGGLVATRLSAKAKTGSQIGVLQPGSPSNPVSQSNMEALRQGLRDPGGHIEGRNISIESTV